MSTFTAASHTAKSRVHKQLRVVVIGAGVGGLATAALLAKQGHQVTVFEKNQVLGGQLAQFKTQGFTFDIGANWYLLPQVIADFFALFDHKPSDFYRLVKLPERFKFWPAGAAAYAIPQSVTELEELLERQEQNGRLKVRSLLGKTSQTLAKLSHEVFTQDFTYPHSYLQLKNWQTAWALQHTYNQVQSWSDLVGSYFKREATQTLFNLSFLPLSADTSQIPALYAALLAAQFQEKIMYPMGGFGEVARAIAQLGWEHGVTTHFQAVEKIVVKDGRAVGVMVGGELVPAEIVVATPDYGYIAQKLLPSAWHDDELARSATHTRQTKNWVVYLGVRRKIDQLAHYNIVTAAKHLPHQSLWSPITDLKTQPTMQCIAASRTDWQVAPTGHENIRLILPMSSAMTDTPAHRQQVVMAMIKHIESLVGQSIREDIVYQRVVVLPDMMTEANFALSGAMAVTAGQILHQRLKATSRQVAGLFYVGESNHPGPGLPLVLLAAQIANRHIMQWGTR